MFAQIKYAYSSSDLQELEQFLAGALFAFVVVFLTNNNFGHVCFVALIASSLFSGYCVVVSTVGAYSMYRA